MLGILPMIIYSGFDVWKLLTVVSFILLQEVWKRHASIYQFLKDWYYGCRSKNFQIKIYSHDIKSGGDPNPLYNRILFWVSHLDRKTHLNKYCDMARYYRRKANGYYTNENTSVLDIEYRLKTPYNTNISIPYKGIIYNINKQTTYSNDDSKKASIEYITIETDTSLSDINNFVKDGLTHYKVEANQGFKNKVLIFRHQKRDGWCHTEMNIKKNFNNIFLASDIRQLLTNLKDEFPKQHQIYDNAGVPFKKGLLLHGNPGTGKTSIIYALASEMKRNIYFLPRGPYLEEDYRTMVESIPNDQIVVLEEIDTIDSMVNNRGLPTHGLTPENILFSPIMTDNEFEHLRTISQLQDNDTDTQDNDTNTNTNTNTNTDDSQNKTTSKNNNSRNNGTKKNADQFALYLEILDGYNYLRGCIVMMTTNCINKIDPAIYRSGRFDHLIKLDYVSEEQLIEICHFYQIDLTRQQVQQIVAQKTTPGYLINTCIFPNISRPDNIKSAMLSLITSNSSNAQIEDESKSDSILMTPLEQKLVSEFEPETESETESETETND